MIDFNEDEIFFIVLYIGFFLESENWDYICLEIGLFIEDYYDLRINMLKKLCVWFENEVIIKLIENEDFEENFDIILIINWDIVFEKVGFIFIYFLLMMKDIKKISNWI